MAILNIILSFIGLAGWFWIWVRSDYQTGADCRTQLGVILFGVVWLMILVADFLQMANATGTALAIRVFLLGAQWCLQPKLDRRK